MTEDTLTQPVSWKRSCYGFAGFCFLSLLALWFGLRLVLLIGFVPPTVPWAERGRALAGGLPRDLFAALVEMLLLVGWLLVVPQRRWATRWHRRLFWTALFLAAFVQVFLLFVEFFFFDEFKSRFNTVAVDYLLFPYEVFVNIWQSYHVGLVVCVCLLLSGGWLWVAHRLFSRMWERPFRALSRWLCLGATAALAAVLALSLDLKSAHVSDDRTLNEVANNGAISFVAAAWTRHLDYAAFYRTLPQAEAVQRVHRLLAQPNVQFVEAGHPTQRRVAGDPARARLNVVLLLEESLGSEFWGCLGRKDTLTPEMDQLANHEGMLFTNLYASGNRTVRGMEGVLSSFPPLPGDSIVKRDHSDNVETLARVLKRDGYETLFLYGGRGVFDGLRSFTTRNGFDRFIEQKHFPHPTFTSVWGVCDEDLFARTVEECRALAATGKPFLVTALSVSNHKPYTYPKGRIPEDPGRQKRDFAVKYSDFALGEFFRAARKEAFWTNTIFVVIADHGARVYGSQAIPIHSYEIPLLIAGPAVVSGPSRVAQLGCSLDVSPTILGLLGRPYETVFFGRDLLKMKPEDGRVLLNHNRDIGMLAQERLVVLGLMQTVQFYRGDPKAAEMSLWPQPTDADRQIEADATALYQVADDLYMHETYRLPIGPNDGQTVAPSAGAAR